MKNRTLWALALGLIFAGCGGDDTDSVVPTPDLDPVVEPAVVKTLTSPADEATVNIAETETLVFAWTAPEHTSKLSYKVLFDLKDGDFKNPLQSFASDDKGASPTLTLTAAQVDGIAEAAQAAEGASVALRWATETTTGSDKTLSTAQRTLTLVRAAKEPDPDPVDGLHVSGAGTEEGQLFKALENNSFEIYTRLENGKAYEFRNSENGTEERFAIEGTGVVKLAATASATWSKPTGIYRITLDFGANTASVQSIDKVILRHCHKPIWDKELAYAGKGVWQLKSHHVRQSTLQNRPENRFKFVFTIDGTAEHWGKVTGGTRPVIEKYSPLATVGTGQWDGTYGYPEALCDAENLSRWFADVELRMTSEGYGFLYSNPVDIATMPIAYMNPLLTYMPLPDPDVIRADDGNFYLYATESTEATNKNGPIMRSKDLIHWEHVGALFTDATHPQITTNPTARLWAPSINRIGDKYVLYYSQPGKEFKHAIGVATSDSPTGPFTDHGKLIDSNEQGVDISIDAYLYQEDGRNYLFWGSFRKISVLELTADGLAIKDKATQVRKEVAGGQYEGSVVIKRGGYYYLICSTGDYSKNGTYKLVVGRSQNIMGPYVNKAGLDMMKVKHELILKGDEGDDNSVKNFTSPGHCSRIITDDNGQDWILYHCYPNDQSYRCLMLDRIDWVDGWPVAPGQAPSEYGLVAPYFK